MKKRRSKRRPRQRLHPDTVQLIKRISVGLIVLMLLALLITGIWHGTRVTSLNLVEVNVSGGETIPHELVKERAEAELTGTYLRLIPRSFAYLYPQSDIAAALADIPRINNISISRTSGTSLAITFDEFLSDALWCDGDQCVFIDEGGYAFATAPSLQGGAFVRFVSPHTPSVGQSVAITNDYRRLNELIEKLVLAGYDVESVTIDEVRDAFITLSNGGELRITLEQTAEETFGNFETVLSSEEFTELTPGTFQYIDLRFGNKVFVNRTEDEVATTTENTSDEEALFMIDTPATSTIDVAAEQESSTSSAMIETGTSS